MQSDKQPKFQNNPCWSLCETGLGSQFHQQYIAYESFDVERVPSVIRNDDLFWWSSMDQSLFQAFSNRVLRTLPTPVCFLSFLSPCPQLPFFSIIGGSCNKYHFCRDKHVFCRDKSMLDVFVATKLCVATKYFYCDKTFVATKDVFCLEKHDKHVFVSTKPLSRQNW